MKVPSGPLDQTMEKHILVPKHEVLQPEEVQTLCAKYNITLAQLPKVKSNDPGLASLNVKSGDVIKITRKSETALKTVYYRMVISE